jgi:hypothetical protein
MKYYFATILEVSSGMEFGTDYVFATDDNPADVADKTAKYWRNIDGSIWHEDYQAYEEEYVFMSDHGTREIPKEDFDVLSKYLFTAQ